MAKLLGSHQGVSEACVPLTGGQGVFIIGCINPAQHLRGTKMVRLQSRWWVTFCYQIDQFYKGLL
jgi:hypothetical protein